MNEKKEKKVYESNSKVNLIIFDSTPLGTYTNDVQFFGIIFDPPTYHVRLYLLSYVRLFMGVILNPPFPNLP